MLKFPHIWSLFFLLDIFRITLNNYDNHGVYGDISLTFWLKASQLTQASHVRVTLASTSGPWIQTWWMLLGSKHGWRLDDWKGIRLLRIVGDSGNIYWDIYMMIYVYCNIIYIIQWFWEPFYLFDDIPWYTHLYNPELIWLVSHSESGFLSHEGTRKSSLCQTIIVIFFNNYGNARLWKSPLIFQDPSIHPSVHPSIHPSICKMRRFHGKTISGIWGFYGDIPSGKHTKSCGKSSLWMGKSTISMVIFNSYVKLRAGLRVVPEWSYERQWEAHFSAQAQCFLTLVHLWIRVV